MIRLDIVGAREFGLTSSHGEPKWGGPKSQDQTDHKRGHRRLQGVVNICSPVNTALAPAMKHIACSDSASVFLPAARRIIVLGSTIRAVAIVRTSMWYATL